MFKLSSLAVKGRASLDGGGTGWQSLGFGGRSDLFFGMLWFTQLNDEVPTQILRLQYCILSFNLGICLATSVFFLLIFSSASAQQKASTQEVGALHILDPGRCLSNVNSRLCKCPKAIPKVSTPLWLPAVSGQNLLDPVDVRQPHYGHGRLLPLECHEVRSHHLTRGGNGVPKRRSGSGRPSFPKNLTLTPQQCTRGGGGGGSPRLEIAVGT